MDILWEILLTAAIFVISGLQFSLARIFNKEVDQLEKYVKREFESSSRIFAKNRRFLSLEVDMKKIKLLDDLNYRFKKGEKCYIKGREVKFLKETFDVAWFDEYTVVDLEATILDNDEVKYVSYSSLEKDKPKK
jgi:hypothetical protein